MLKIIQNKPKNEHQSCHSYKRMCEECLMLRHGTYLRRFFLERSLVLELFVISYREQITNYHVSPSTVFLQ